MSFDSVAANYAASFQPINIGNLAAGFENVKSDIAKTALVKAALDKGNLLAQLGSTALSQAGAMAQGQQTIDYNKWAYTQQQKANNRANALTLLRSAGEVFGLGPGDVGNVSSLDLLNGYQNASNTYYSNAMARQNAVEQQGSNAVRRGMATLRAALPSVTKAPGLFGG